MGLDILWNLGPLLGAAAQVAWDLAVFVVGVGGGLWGILTTALAFVAAVLLWAGRAGTTLAPFAVARSVQVWGDPAPTLTLRAYVASLTPGALWPPQVQPPLTVLALGTQ